MILVLVDMLEGKVEVELCLLLEVWVYCEGSEIFCVLVLNDVVVVCGFIFGMVELWVEVDGCFMYN